METIIRQLAVIGVPVDSSVVCQCPDVVRRLKDLLTTEIIGSLAGVFPKLRNKYKDTEPLGYEYAIPVVALALEILAARWLAFRFITHLDHDGSAIKGCRGRHRYQVHRLVQLYIHRKLGSQSVEPSDSYSFTVSLFAAQTRELPILNANSYAFINRLMDGLTNFPSLKERDRFSVEPLAITKSRCLRAALGIARTLFG